MKLSVPETVAARRIDGLDVLRGLSIVAVILLHVNILVPLGKSPAGQHLPNQVLHAFLWNGFPGVVIFFTISGFLITTTCLRRWGNLQSIPIRDFYRMRFARIAPCLLALLAILSVLHLASVPGFSIDPQRASLPRALFAALTFHINWLEAKVGYLPANWDVLWSLSVEETFYLLFPLAGRWLNNRLFSALLFVFVIAGPFARTVLTNNEIWADHGYLSCMDAIALGCFAALIAHRYKLSSKSLLPMQILGTGMLAFIMIFNRLAFRLHVFQTGLDVTLLALGTSLLAISFTQRQNEGSYWTGLLRWFGRNSYEVYLTHGFIVLTSVQVFRIFQSPPMLVPWLYLLIVCLAGLLGAVVARSFSEPLNRRLRALAKLQPHPIARHLALLVF